MLDLPDAFTRQAELAPDLLERVTAPVLQAETQAKDARLAGRQCGQDIVQFLPQHVLVGGIRRRG